MVSRAFVSDTHGQPLGTYQKTTSGGQKCSTTPSSHSTTARRQHRRRAHFFHRCRLRRRRNHKTQHICLSSHHERRPNQLEQSTIKALRATLGRTRGLCSHRKCKGSNPHQAPLRRNENSTTRRPHDNLVRQQRLHPNRPQDPRRKRRKTL